ncbi:hypothetical protein LguiB_007265 [Lonicera macranthoides]
MEGKETKDLLINAIKIGYCQFDCAAKYKNEEEVGEALAEAFETGLVKRKDLFVTTRAAKFALRFSEEAWPTLSGPIPCSLQFPVSTTRTGIIGKTASVMGEDEVLVVDTTISLESTWHAYLVSMGLVHGIGIRSIYIR